jgi:hypothetical protein
MDGCSEKFQRGDNWLQNIHHLQMKSTVLGTDNVVMVYCDSALAVLRGMKLNTKGDCSQSFSSDGPFKIVKGRDERQAATFLRLTGPHFL